MQRFSFSTVSPIPVSTFIVSFSLLLTIAVGCSAQSTASPKSSPASRAASPIITPPARRDDEVDTQVVSLALNQSWNDLLNRLGTRPPRDLSVVECNLKGHACLAANRNNEAVEILYSDQVNGDRAMKSWLNWTEQLVAKHPTQEMGAYLRGDALARDGQLDKAIAEFTRGISINPKNALLFNSRGVCYACQQKWLEAADDFDEAKGLAPSFADPYANDGDLYIQQSQNPKNALKAFDEALKRSPNFSFALIGKASALFGLSGFDEAKQILTKLSTVPSCGILAIANLKITQDAQNETLLLAAADRLSGVAIAKTRADLRSLNTSYTDINLGILANKSNNFADPASKAAITAANYAARVLDPLRPTTVTYSAADKTIALSFSKTALQDSVTAASKPVSNLINQHAQTENMNLDSRSKTLNLINEKTSQLKSLLAAPQQDGGVTSKRLGSVLKDNAPWNLLAPFSLPYRAALVPANTLAAPAKSSKSEK